MVFTAHETSFSRNVFYVYWSMATSAVSIFDRSWFISIFAGWICSWFLFSLFHFVRWQASAFVAAIATVVAKTQIVFKDNYGKFCILPIATALFGHTCVWLSFSLASSFCMCVALQCWLNIHDNWILVGWHGQYTFNITVDSDQIVVGVQNMIHKLCMIFCMKFTCAISITSIRNHDRLIEIISNLCETNANIIHWYHDKWEELCGNRQMIYLILHNFIFIKFFVF